MIAHHQEGGGEDLPRTWDEVRRACHRWLMQRDPVYRAENLKWHDRHGDYQRRMKKAEMKSKRKR